MGHRLVTEPLFPYTPPMRGQLAMNTDTEDEMKYDEPKYEHDCESCIYLGRHTEADEEYDLYICPQAVRPTVLARWGNDGPEYSCGMLFALDDLTGRVGGCATTRALGEALRRALANGYARLTVQMVAQS